MDTKGQQSIGLEPVPFAKVAPYAKAAAKERVSVTDTKNTVWLWAKGGQGFCGLMTRPDMTVRLKAFYVMPEWRNRLVGPKMLQEELDFAIRTLNAKAFETFTVNPAFFGMLGFQRIRETHPGVWYMRKSL